MGNSTEQEPDEAREQEPGGVGIGPNAPQLEDDDADQQQPLGAFTRTDSEDDITREDPFDKVGNRSVPEPGTATDQPENQPDDQPEEQTPPE